MNISKLNIAPVFIAVVLFISCNNEDTINKEQPLQSIPYVVGSSNSYRWSSTQDSSGKIIATFSDSFKVTIKSNSESIKGFTNLSLLEATPLNSSTVIQKVWYRSNADSLTEMAYQFSSSAFIPGISVFPKQQSTLPLGSILSLPLSLQILLSQKHLLDSVTMRDDPRVVYKFPLIQAKKWTSFSSPFLQTREVVGNEMVTVRAGTFYCAKIQSRFWFDSTEPLEYYDYVCSEGLILRTLSGRFIMTTAEGPDGAGVFINITDRLELIAKN